MRMIFERSIVIIPDDLSDLARARAFGSGINERDKRPALPGTGRRHVVTIYEYTYRPQYRNVHAHGLAGKPRGRSGGSDRPHAAALRSATIISMISTPRSKNSTSAA